MSRHTSNDHPPPGRFLVQRRRHVWWMMRIILILLLLRLLLLVVPPSLVRRSSSSLSSSSFPSFFPKLPVTDSTLTTRIDQQQQQHHHVLLQNATTVLCINDVPYGQTFNMLLTMATARILAYELSKNTSTVVKVGLGPTFSDFYLATLEPHDDVLTHYFSQKGWTILQTTTPATTATTTTNHSNMCHVEYRSQTLFELFFQPNWYTDTRRSIIQSLIPNANLRQQAVTYLQQQQRRRRRRYPFSSHNDTLIITTVHRRNFEGTCEELVERGDHVACWDPRTGHPRNNNHSFLAPMELLNTIYRRTYPMIQRDLNISQNRGIGNWMSRYFDSSDHHHHHHHHRYIILLCTDRQVKKYDRTFPNWVSISPHDIPKDHPTYRPAVILIEAWIMTLSDIHYGVPMSTVDVVVNFWRNRPEWLVGPDNITQREMRPVSCYGTTANDGNV